MIIHHQGRCHHIERQKGSSTREGKIEPGRLFTQNSMMRTPYQFIATCDNIRASMECCFHPPMWQSEVYLGAERSKGLHFITNTERLSITDSENSITKNCVLCARKEVNNNRFFLKHVTGTQDFRPVSVVF